MSVTATATLRFRLSVSSFVLIGGLILSFCGVADAWQIESFQTHVELHADSTATITETIVADFTNESRRGLYRDLPVHYTDRAGQHFVMRLRVEAVTDAEWQPWPYRLKSHGRYLRLRVGDPHRTVTGLQTYRLVYRVQRGAVRFFPDHDEFYWNLTGNEWAVPIRRAQAQLELPAAAREVRALGYVGAYGSRRQMAPSLMADRRIAWEIPQGFGPYEGLTAVVGWAKGAVRPPSAWQVLIWWSQDNWVYAIPLLVLLGMWWLWHAKGRDPQLSRSQVVEYEPPEGLTPAEMGVLLDHKAQLREITSTIIDLAARGYLRIEPIETRRFGRSRVSDYRLVSMKPWMNNPQLKSYEQKMLDGLFPASGMSMELSELEHVFYKHLPKIRDDLYTGLVQAKYLDGHPEKIRTRYWLIGGLIGGVGAFVAPAMAGPMMAGATIVAMVLAALVIAVFGYFMPRRTMQGAKATDRILGFLEFLRRADADRMKRINDPTLFERGLPYALAFGVATQWAKAFEGLYTAPPAWYGGEWDRFSPSDFSRDLNRTMRSVDSTLTSRPQSSSRFGGSGFGGGGGFSGGGGGGGGGGAW